MNKSKFISSFKDFIQCAVRLNEMTLKKGISSLDYELEDLNDEFFKQGLRFVVNKTDTSIGKIEEGNWKDGEFIGKWK